jgi:transcription antitermination factor NusG
VSIHRHEVRNGLSDSMNAGMTMREAGRPILPTAESDAIAPSRWYAAYTCSRHEKHVRKQLEERDIRCFLPVYRGVRRWKDRRKELELALFPGYVFVRIGPEDRLRVLQIPSVVRFVGFGGCPAALEDDEIESLRSGVAHGARVEPHPYLRVGRKILVKRGPLAGTAGILTRKKDKYRVVLSIDLIMRSVAVEVDAADLE